MAETHAQPILFVGGPADGKTRTIGPVDSYLISEIVEPPSKHPYISHTYTRRRAYINGEMITAMLHHSLTDEMESLKALKKLLGIQQDAGKEHG